jgi:hypothetical protein
MPRLFLHTLRAATLAALATACSDAGGPAQSEGSELSFNLATRAAPAASGAAFAVAESYTDGAGNVLTFDRVQLVLREVELENDALESAEVEIGPFLVDLPLGTPGAARAFAASVPAGTYDEVKFKIREPDDDAEDAAFRAQHPEFTDVSIRAEGSFNGAPFVWVSRLEAELELDLAPALVVGETATTDLTILVDLGAWFRDGGALFVDPSTANQGGANRELVRQNVVASFNAFEDHDHDGSDDHGGHGSDDSGPDDHGSGGHGADD